LQGLSHADAACGLGMSLHAQRAVLGVVHWKGGTAWLRSRS
jgi:hypothetical protein